MCRISLFNLAHAGRASDSSARAITVDDGMVIYVAKRGERSPSDSHWLIPSPPTYVERVYSDPPFMYDGDRAGLLASLGLSGII